MTLRVPLTLAVTAALASGCAMLDTPKTVATAPTPVAAPANGELKARMDELAKREAAVVSRERDLAQQAETLRKQQATAPAPQPVSTRGEAELLPPNAKSGECYARVIIPPQYKTESEQVLKRAASERVEVIPAKFGPATEKIMVRPASKKLEVIPATFDTVEEKVLVRPASKRIETAAAQYETVEEKVLVKPAYTTWKKGRGGLQEKIDTATGEVMCLVEVPAEYRTVTKQVVKTPASTREVEVPAEYSTVKKVVEKTPARTREVEIPAEYKEVTITKEVQPAQEKRVPIPAEYQTVTRTMQVSDSRVEWRSILCETNATPQKITEIQGALKKAGYDPGPLNGQISERMLVAVNNYQKAKSLPQDNFLNLETVKSLGVNPTK